MSMSALMCPHCGGRLLIDPTQRLQSMLTCPYCARKSLMQKKNGMIVLRGIISQNNPLQQEPSTEESSAPAEPADSHVPSESADSIIRPESMDTLTPAELLTNAVSSEPAAPAAGWTPAEQAMPAVSFEPSSSIEEAAPTVSAALESVPGSIETLTVREPPSIPEHSLQGALPSAHSNVDEQSAHTLDTPVAEQDMLDSTGTASSSDQEIPAGSHKPRQDRLIMLASQAAASGQVMLFNSYARQAIDCDPADPRAYVLRARLIEEAHGFARATFLSPVWMSQTPRQKAWTLAQHFSSFNAAVAFSADPARSSLATEVGALIAWQIRESFLENARLRLGKRVFKGRFQRRDLSTAPRIIDACAHINETVVPHIAGDLLRSVRLELEKLDSRLADQLQRIGF